MRITRRTQCVANFVRLCQSPAELEFVEGWSIPNGHKWLSDGTDYVTKSSVINRWLKFYSEWTETRPHPTQYAHKWGAFYAECCISFASFSREQPPDNSTQLRTNQTLDSFNWIHQQMMSHSTDLAHWARNTQERRMGCNRCIARCGVRCEKRRTTVFGVC